MVCLCTGVRTGGATVQRASPSGWAECGGSLHQVLHALQAVSDSTPGHFGSVQATARGGAGIVLWGAPTLLAGAGAAAAGELAACAPEAEEPQPGRAGYRVQLLQRALLVTGAACSNLVFPGRLVQRWPRMGRSRDPEQLDGRHARSFTQRGEVATGESESVARFRIGVGSDHVHVATLCVRWPRV